MDCLRIVFIDRKSRWEGVCKEVYDNLQREGKASKGLRGSNKPFKFRSKILWKTIDVRKVKDEFPPKKGESCAFISPANSYGAMDGGIDDIYSIMFPGPPTIEEVVQECIKENTVFYGKSPYPSKTESQPVIPVGSGLVVPVPKEDKTFLVCVPTMVLPNDVSKSKNAYYATFAALKVVEKYNKSLKYPIKTIYISGMCTGCGMMPLEQAINQSMRAVKDWEEYGHPYDNVMDTPSNVLIFSGLHLKRNIDMSGHKFTVGKK